MVSSYMLPLTTDRQTGNHLCIHMFEFSSGVDIGDAPCSGQRSYVCSIMGFTKLFFGSHKCEKGHLDGLSVLLCPSVVVPACSRACRRVRAEVGMVWVGRMLQMFWPGDT